MRVAVGDLLVFLHPAQEDNHTIMAPESFISSLVHPGMLLLPSAEGVDHKAVSSHDWLTLVASCQHDAADVQLPCLPYIHSTISQLQLQEGNVLDRNLTVSVKSETFDCFWTATENSVESRHQSCFATSHSKSLG